MKPDVPALVYGIDTEFNGPEGAYPDMSESSDRSERFSNLRDAFNELAFEEKATFLVETAVGVVVESVKKAGEMVADTLDNSCKAEESEGEQDESSSGKKT